MLKVSGAVLAALSGMLVAGAALADEPLATTENGKVALGLLDMCFNQHDVEGGFAKYVGPYYKQHNPTVPDGKEAAIKGLSGFVAQVPTMHYDFKHVIAQGDMVAVHAHVTLNPQDRGNAVVDIFRFENGKIVEHWDVLQPVPAEAKNDNTMF